MESEERKNMEPSAGTRDDMVGKNVSAAQESSTAVHVVTEEPQTSVMSEEDALKNLTEKVRDQSELERYITVEANSVLMKAEDSKDENRIVKLEATKQRLQQQLDKEKKKTKRVSGNPYQSRNLRREIESLEREIFQVTQDVCICQARIEKRHRESLLETTHVSKSKRLPDESNRQYLIRTGKITPFAQLASAQAAGIQGELANVIIDAEQEAAADLFQHETKGPTSHQSLRHPGFIDKNEAQDTDNLEPNIDSDSSMRPRKRRRTQKQRSPSGDSDYSDSLDSGLRNATFSQHENEDVSIRRQKHKTKAKVKVNEQEAIDLSKIDDGNEAHYQRRLRDWVTRRSRARQARQQSQDSNDMGTESDAMEDEWFKPSPDHADHFFGDSLKLPGDIHPALFEYQKTGVQWLAELYKQHVGGIIGDEMGLGKTVQLIAFIAALHFSKKLKRPVIVVAPATLLRQWVNEFHRWWPPLRVAIMHSSGSGMMHTRQEDEYDTESHRPVAKKSLSAAKRIVRGVVNRGHVLVTTYTGLLTYSDELLPVEWEYAVLDEGHKIRNPNAEITVTCKELNTPNRVILSGTPVQNNLTELWSLFDFIYPMRLGTLVNFRTQFEIPIRHGGYADASNLQVMTAEKCAEALKETIGQYLLQRLKVDVAADLPEKTEQVLFCRLTDGQRQAYELFLKSDEVSAILNRRRQSLYGIDVLRKICNHPDLLDKSLSTKTGYEFGSPKLSAKLQLTKDLLQKIMIPHGHKMLLFSQGRKMLDIIEKCIQKCGITYLRMDGETPVDNRQPMIDKFNSDPDVHVFLLTTRTGGLGTNLTGADRIIIFDPDWNPSTDLQARERAWRLGQNKPVKIYRLMTEGTIEEKIYHRQIFKQFMTNKVLKDPKQRSSYDLSDLYDLFSYNPGHNAALERSEIFRGAEVDLAAVASDSTDGQKLQLADSAARPSTYAEKRKLEHMKLVSAVEDYRQEASVHDEKRMLEGIFARSVNSAYDHEQIVNGHGKIQADINILREEANHVARQAAAHLRQSEEDARHIPIGTVTWTGEVGSGGRRVAPRRFGGPSSAGVMNNLATRQGLGRAATDGGSRAAVPGTGTNLTAKEFAPMIKTFVNRHGGRVPSKMIVDHFDRYCAKKKQSNEFKTALDSVAVLHKAGSSGRGMWSLKPAS